MNPDLRTFLDSLPPDLLVQVDRPVALDFEVPVLQEKLALDGRYPVLSCRQVEGSELPLVSGLFGSYELLGLALGGAKRRRLGEEYLRREAHLFEPVEVKTAPVQEVVLRGADADLTRLPIGQHAEQDGGRYLTIGCLVCRDPDTGTVNAGCYRHQLKGPRRLGCMINPANDAAYIYRKCKERALPMEVAIFVGHHPAAVMGALARAGFGNSEYRIMGALLGEPLEVVRGISVDLPVPAAEFVIEGVIRPGDEEREGPFGEYTGYYGPEGRVPVIDVTAITLRRDAIFHDLDPAHREHFMSSAPAKEGQVLRRVQSVVPSVRAVCLPPSACCLYHVYLSLSKRVPGEGRWAGIVALGCNHNFKHVVVVDDDIDVFDEAEVMWAVATRVEADQDLTMIPNTLGAHLDPSSYGETRSEAGPMTTRMVVDATRPVNQPFAARVRPPAEVWDRVRLEDYLGSAGGRPRAERCERVNDTWIVDEAEQGRFLVDRRVFTDPEILSLELQTVFSRCWLYVGHESEIRSPGDFVTRTVGARPLILIRGTDGEARVLFNTCTHEGSMVCRVPRGNGLALQCFFHGWTYDTRGELTGIPGRDGYGGSFDPAGYGLRRPAQVASYRGLVFMNQAADAPDLLAYLGPAREFLDLVLDEADEGMELLPGSHRYSTRANWKLLSMNSADGYHVATAHVTYLEYLRDMGIDTTGGWKVGRRHDLGNGHTAAEFYAKWARPVARWCRQFPEEVRPRIEARRAQLTERWGEERAHRIAEVDRNLFVFPNLVINDHSAILIRTFDPLAADHLEVTTWALGPVDEDPDLRALRLANYVTFWGPAGFATPDDVEALETAQRAIAAEGGGWTDVSKGALREHDPERQSNTDELQLRAFWRHWRRWVGGHALAGRP